jgi:thymidine kinase
VDPCFLEKQKSYCVDSKEQSLPTLRVEIFKPQIDTRYHDSLVVSHDANHIQSNPVSVAENILLYANEVDVIGIDEAQFFDDRLPEVCNQLAAKGYQSHCRWFRHGF